MNRKNLIDGLPNSYNTSYVILTGKCCMLCNTSITEKNISDNQIVCTQEFDFYHKDYVKQKQSTYKHQNPQDKSTPVVLDKKIEIQDENK